LLVHCILTRRRVFCFRVMFYFVGSPSSLTLLQNSAFVHSFLSCVRASSSSIYIANYGIQLLFRSSKPFNSAFQSPLLVAASRGVDVRIISRRTSHRLLNLPENFSIRFFSGKNMFHPKFAVFDARCSIVGSHNLSFSAVRLNEEMSVLIDDTSFSEDLSFSFLSYWRDSSFTPPRDILAP